VYLNRAALSAAASRGLGATGPRSASAGVTARPPVATGR
jgi:hypothetical protein